MESFRWTRAHDNTVPYQRLHNIYVVLDVERPLRYIRKIPNRAAWEGVSVQYKAIHDPYNMNYKVLGAHKKSTSIRC